MAIEGLSGVRGIQTQSVAAPKPVTTGRQEVPVFRTSQAAATYDKAANAVDTAVEKDNAASKTEQGQETADKEQIRKAVEKLNKNMSRALSRDEPLGKSSFSILRISLTEMARLAVLTLVVCT